MKYYNYNEERLKAQWNYLKKCLYVLNEGDFINKFQVLDNECGSGKTIASEKIMSDIINKNNTYNYLFVRERNADGIESAKRINELAGETIAIAINTDTHNYKQYNKIKETLKNYKVLIISHEKYKALSVDNINRKYFSENRDILIIDEFLDMSKGNELQISKQYINSFESLLNHRTLRTLYIEIIGEIEDYLLSEKKHSTFFNTKNNNKDINKKINKLKLLLKKTLTNEYVKSIGCTKKGLCKKLDELKQFYNQTCICENNIIYCTNREYQHWFLPKYNCILDASAKLNPAYKLSDKFILQHQSKVFNHKEWSFTIVKTNSNQKSKERAIDYYKTINEIIANHTVDGFNETLIVGNKNDEKYIESINKNHFMNLTGSNEYKDLKNIIIIHNPNIPYRIYVLGYLYYSNLKLDNRNSWEGIKDGSKDNMVYRFKENRFEDYRQMRNADQIYQAIKRINRCMEYQSKVIIFNKDNQVIDRVLKMFNGIEEIIYMDNFIKFEKTKQDEYNEERKENRLAMQFIKLCGEIANLNHNDLQQEKKNRKGEMIRQKDIYSKKNITNYLNIDKKNFSQLVMNDLDVIEFLKRHNINNNVQTIDFSNYRI